MPLHKKKLYLQNETHKLKFPGADWAANKTLNLPLHANLTMREVNYICKMIERFLANGK
jgi:dTDP-4-amino-4,6-dideoxygalactose transaminase